MSMINSLQIFFDDITHWQGVQIRKQFDQGLQFYYSANVFFLQKTSEQRRVNVAATS